MVLSDVSLPLEVSRRQIERFCRRHRIVRLGFFGSVLRDDFDAESDVDVIVDFSPRAKRGSATFKAADELSDLLGRKVDLVTFDDVHRSPFRFACDPILDTAKIYYDATAG